MKDEEDRLPPDPDEDLHPLDQIHMRAVEIWESLGEREGMTPDAATGILLDVLTRATSAFQEVFPQAQMSVEARWQVIALSSVLENASEHYRRKFAEQIMGPPNGVAMFAINGEEAEELMSEEDPVEFLRKLVQHEGIRLEDLEDLEDAD